LREVWEGVNIFEKRVLRGIFELKGEVTRRLEKTAKYLHKLFWSRIMHESNEKFIILVEMSEGICAYTRE
jgi:hypothetical protein